MERKNWTCAGKRVKVRERDGSLCDMEIAHHISHTAVLIPYSSSSALMFSVETITPPSYGQQRPT
jgi:hypothetical protein